MHSANTDLPQHRKLIFPLFNALVALIFGTLIGYYVFLPLQGALIGAVTGFLLALLIEIALSRLHGGHWLYRRRVLLSIFIECLLAVFVVGPYAYAYVQTLPDQHPVCCQTPLDFGAKTYETMTVEADDGILLAGWYVPPAEPSGAVIVLLHGGGGDRLGMAWHAEVLIAAGYGVFMYDQRAYGESTGDIATFGWDDAGDLIKVIETLEQRDDFGSEIIGAVGLSAGGQIALGAAGRNPEWNYPLWIDGVGAQRIADFPPAENIGERFATLINRLILKMVEFRIGHKPPPAFVDVLPTLEGLPITFIVAGGDPYEPRQAERFREVAPPGVEFWVIENAWHVGGPAVVPEDYRGRMLEFFETAFGK